MKSVALLVLLALITFHAGAQANRKPKIVGQETISINEDESVTILMTYLQVEDPDDWFYPWGFSMTLYPGSNYTYSGAVVTPSPDFYGTLVVPVTVNDGTDESNKFDFQITVNPVNDAPVISGHAPLTVKEGQSLTIAPGHLTVIDPDDKYPDDFTLTVHAGTNYSVSGTTITPAPGFAGMLAVNVTVNDGEASSAVYALPVEVKPVNRVPEITGQAALQVPEDGDIAILLSHLTVVDEDSNYPTGFTLSLSPGKDYTLSGATVIPAPDYFGKLSVPVTVNDGKNTSKPYSLTITVTPVNDPPRVSALEAGPLFYGVPDVPVAITETAKVEDVDGDSIMYAEIGFRPDGYQANADELEYTAPEGSNIKGTFDAATGVLTLMGQASPEGYTRALRAVSFHTVAGTGEKKTLYILVHDGKSASEVVERILLFGKAAVSLDIPTGFTPNGDLTNDTWKIIPLKSEEAYSTALVRVYNKSGVLVYESVGFESEWDGRMNGELLPADTYFYTIDLRTSTPEGYVKGIVTILR